MLSRTCCWHRAQYRGIRGTMGRYIENAAEGTLFIDGSLESLLPENSPARTVWAAILALDFSAFDARYRNDAMGRLAIDPRRVTAIWVLALIRGVLSAPRLAALCRRDIEFRWLLGGAPVEKSTLSAFRKDHIEALSGLSTQVLSALSLSNLLPGESVAVDGTIVRAASSVGKSRRRKHIERALRKLEGVVSERLSAAEEDAGEKAPQRGKKSEKEKLEEALRTMDALGLSKQGDRLTLSEPGVSMKKLKGNSGFAPAHNVQAVTDVQSGAIIHAEVVEAGNDEGQLAPQIAKANEILEQVGAKPIKEVAADSGYHDTLDLVELEAKQLTAFVPNDRNENRRPPGVTDEFTADKFRYNEDTDTFTCPAGHELRRRKPTDVSHVYQARKADCAACPHKQHCCPKAKGGRNVNRPKYTELLKTVAERAASEAGQVAAAQRRTTAEGIFARLKTHLHWPRCRLWGKRGATAELLWRQFAHNLLLLTGYWAPLAHRPQMEAQAA